MTLIKMTPYSGLQIIFPEANKKDYDELTVELKEGLSPHFVSQYEQVFKLALEYDGPIVVPKATAAAEPDEVPKA